MSKYQEYLARQIAQADPAQLQECKRAWLAYEKLLRSLERRYPNGSIPPDAEAQLKPLRDRKDLAIAAIASIYDEVSKDWWKEA